MPDKRELIDKVAKFYLGTQAASRTTKTPIAMGTVPPPKYINEPERVYPEPTMAQYIHPGKEEPQGLIEIANFKEQPRMSDISSAIGHESIHALLKDIVSNKLEAPSWGIQQSVQDKAYSAIEEGKRGGNPIREVPAYVGAYSSSKMPGFSEDDRRTWLKDFYTTLSPETRLALQRIVNNYDASQFNSPIN